MKKTKQLLSLVLLLVLGIQGVAFGVDKVKPLFSKVNYLPNDTEAEIEANSMKWFEERVKFVKENIKILPDDFMEDWNWNDPLTRIEFLILMTPVRNDKELLWDINYESVYGGPRTFGDKYFTDIDGTKELNELWDNNKEKFIKEFDNGYLQNKYPNLYKLAYVYYPQLMMNGDSFSHDKFMQKQFELIALHKSLDKSFEDFSEQELQNLFEENWGVSVMRKTDRERKILATTFRPDENIIFIEALKVSMEAIDNRKFNYSDSLNWYEVYLEKFKELDEFTSFKTYSLTEELTIADLSKIMFLSLFDGIDLEKKTIVLYEDEYFIPSWGEKYIDCDKSNQDFDKKRLQYCS